MINLTYEWNYFLLGYMQEMFEAKNSRKWLKGAFFISWQFDLTQNDIK